MKIEVKNEGLTNSMAFARHNKKYDIDSLLKREGIYDKIVELASHEYYCKGNGGDIKWSFSGKDIWVNIEGKQEVEIKDDRIKLIDFENNEYEIDFNGIEISEK